MPSNGLQSTADTQRCDDILVVDDTPANLVALTAVLDRLGVRVVTANSGEAALRLLSERDFALLLLDVNMPTMDGFEVARHLRDGGHAKGTPIIFITAHAHENTRSVSMRGCSRASGRASTIVAVAKWNRPHASPACGPLYDFFKHLRMDGKRSKRPLAGGGRHVGRSSS